MTCSKTKVAGQSDQQPIVVAVPASSLFAHECYSLSRWFWPFVCNAWPCCSLPSSSEDAHLYTLLRGHEFSAPGCGRVPERLLLDCFSGCYQLLLQQVVHLDDVAYMALQSKHISFHTMSVLEPRGGAGAKQPQSVDDIVFLYK